MNQSIETYRQSYSSPSKTQSHKIYRTRFSSVSPASVSPGSISPGSVSWFNLSWFSISWFALSWFNLSWFSLSWFNLSWFSLLVRSLLVQSLLVQSICTKHYGILFASNIEFLAISLHNMLQSVLASLSLFHSDYCYKIWSARWLFVLQ